MHKATELLIKERNRWTKLKLSVAEVQRIGGDPVYKSYYNAMANRSKDVLGSGSTDNEVVSGWIVYPLCEPLNQNEISQRWWNFDPIAGLFFDTTDLNEQNFPPNADRSDIDYVIDPELKVLSERLPDRLERNLMNDLISWPREQWSYSTYLDNEDFDFVIIDVKNLKATTFLSTK